MSLQALADEMRNRALTKEQQNGAAGEQASMDTLLGKDDACVGGGRCWLQKVK